MNEYEIISKLKTLKAIKPDENWVISVRKRVLDNSSPFVVSSLSFPKAEARHCLIPVADVEARHCLVPTIEKRSAFGLNPSNLAKLLFNQLAFSLSALVFVLTSAYLTVNASMASLPGDSLYPVKIASENVVSAVAAEKDKPGIAVEQAGKRLEEMDKLSQKVSDAGQQRKIENLVKEYKGSIAKANEQFANLKDKSQKAEAAKVITSQTEKYPEALQKAANNLSAAVKEKVINEVAMAISATEKVNTQALLIMVEADGGNADLVSKVKAKIEKIEKSSVKTEASENKEEQPKEAPAAEALPKAELKSDSEGSNVLKNQDNEAKSAPESTKQELIKKAKENLESNNLIGAVKNVAEAEAIESENKSGDKIEWQVMPVPADN